MPADKVLKLTAQPEWTRFEAIADGYQVPATNLIEYVHSGKQAHVPLIEGWVSEDRPAKSLLGDQPPTAEGYAAAVRKVFGANADRVLALYPGAQTKEQVLDAAQTFGHGCRDGIRHVDLRRGASNVQRETCLPFLLYAPSSEVAWTG